MMAAEFNFEEWILQNNLTEAKDLFIKHNVTTPQSITIGSDQFKSLMVDPKLFEKCHTIPIIMDAMQKIQFTSAKPREKVVRVLISDNEQQVIDTIEKHLHTLNGIEQELNRSKENKLRIKNEKHTKIERAQTKITKLFDELCCALNKKRLNFLKQFENMKDINSDDEKEIYLVNESLQNINNCQDYLNRKLQICDKLTLNNENRKERKSKILNIRKEIERNKLLKNNLNNINIQPGSCVDSIVNIDFIINNNVYKTILSGINDIEIGYVVNKTYELVKQNKIYNDSTCNTCDKQRLIRHNQEILVNLYNQQSNKNGEAPIEITQEPNEVIYGEWNHEIFVSDTADSDKTNEIYEKQPGPGSKSQKNNKKKNKKKKKKWKKNKSRDI